MSTVQQIFNDIYEGKSVTIAVGTFERFETLRTSLVKKNSFMNAFGEDDLSLVGTFDKETGHATFARAKSRKKIREDSWQVISSEGSSSTGNNGEDK